MLGRKKANLLQATFETVLRQAQEACRICVFIDGLDEFSGDQEVLMKLIGKVQTADVKVCLSSRPYRSYREAFGSSAKLQLQDMTKSDIKRYVSDKLHPLVKTGLAEQIHGISDTVVRKAEGVFLWVELVVKDLIKGLKNDDTLKQLQERLNFMPSDIEDLYTHMLGKIDKVYQTQAAKLFQMVLLNPGHDLSLHGLAHFIGYKKTSDIGLSDIIAYSEVARNKIPTICAGLLEVHTWDKWLGPEEIDRERVRGRMFRSADPSLSLTIQYAESSELAQVAFLRNHTDVEFSHRTARDYLLESKQGKQFMETNSVLDFNPYISYVNALLTQATLLGFASTFTLREGNAQNGSDYDNYDDYDDHEQDRRANAAVHEIMQNVCLAERGVETPQISLCDDIDGTLAAIHNRHGLPSPKILRGIMENISVAERKKGTAQTSIRADYEDVLANLNRPPSSKAHWSVRWGVSRHSYVTGGGEIADLSPSSRSSSTGPFHSINIKPTLLENSSVLPTKPVDFVGVAASYGLSRYVEQKLLCQSQTVDQDTANYLLCCSLWALNGHARVGDEEAYREIMLRTCAFIPELLKLGADCNIYVEDFSNTLWGDFLTQTTWIIDDGRWYERSDIKRVYFMLTKAFLEHGADVHVRVYREVAVRVFGLGFFDVKVALEMEGCQRLTFLNTNTALYSIQEDLGDMPEFDTLQKQFLKKGGSSSSRWTHIALGSTLFKISEQQNDDFKAAFRAYAADDDGTDDSMQTRKKRALQIARLCKDICGDYEDTDKFGPSEVTPWWDTDSHKDFGVEASIILRLHEGSFPLRGTVIQL